MGKKIKEQAEAILHSAEEMMSTFSRLGSVALEVVKEAQAKAEAARQDAMSLHVSTPTMEVAMQLQREIDMLNRELLRANETNRRLHRRLQLLEGWTKTRMGYPLEQKIEEAAQEAKPTRLRPAKPSATAKVVTTETVPAEEALK